MIRPIVQICATNQHINPDFVGYNALFFGLSPLGWFYCAGFLARVLGLAVHDRGRLDYKRSAEITIENFMNDKPKKGSRLAIIDDDRILQRILSTKLEALGYDVSVYDGATQAVAGLKAKAVDLIILDLIMPEMDGFEFLKYWRDHGSALVIVLSNLSDPADCVRMKRIAANYR